jgi:tetratricopeptide (TPR) repeat protein
MRTSTEVRDFHWTLIQESNSCSAQLYSRRGDKKLALIDFQRVVELDSSKALAYLELGILNKELSNDHETTLTYLNRAIAYGTFKSMIISGLL